MSLAECKPAKLKQINRKIRSVAALNATNKRESVSKLVKAWESKNAKRAAQGAGLSTMAVTLAACGGGSDTPTTPADQTAVQGSGRLYLKQLDAITTVDSIPLPDNLSLQTAETAAGGLAGFVEALKIVNVEAQYLDVTGSNGNDTFYADTYAVHGIDITAGAGIDTLEVNMKGPWAQVGSLDGVEVVHVVNNENEYLVSRMAGWDINVKELEPIKDSADVATNSVLDLFNAPDVTKLVVSEGSFNTVGTLEVRNVNDDAEIELRGSFSQDTLITYKGGVGVLNLTLSDFFVDAAGTDIELLHQSHHVKLTSTSASTSGVNDINGIVFQNELRVLEISGDAELNAGNDGNALVFDADRKAVIDASKLKADLLLEVAAHGDVTYTGTDQTTGIDSLTVTGANDNGETRISLKADFGAGSSAVNVLTISGTTIMNSDSFVKADAGAGVTLLLDTAATIDATKADLSGVDKVVFGTNDKLEITAAQFDAIREKAADSSATAFVTKDNANADGQLTISGVTGETDLDLSSVDNGNLFVVKTVDAKDVILSTKTVLGNLQDGVGELHIMAESGNASVTLTAAQFTQLKGTGTIEVVGLGATPGNDPDLNVPFEGTATITGVSADTVLVLTDTSAVAAANRLSELTIKVDGVTASSKFSITDGNAAANLKTVLEISGTTDLSKATLTGVDGIKLLNGADVTLTKAQIEALDISGPAGTDATANINVNADLVLNSTNQELDLTKVTITFTKEGAAELTIDGAKDVTLKGVKTNADVTALTIDNNLTAGTLDITGGSPALDLNVATKELTIESVNTSKLNVGTNPAQPDIVAPGVKTMTVTAASGEVNLGKLDSVDPAFALTVTNGAKTTVELVGATPNSNLSVNGAGVTVKIAEGVDFGAGTNLLLTGVILESETDVSGVLAPTSTLTINSTYTVAEINDLLDAAGTGGVTAVATGMSAQQLSALAAKAGKVAAISGSLVITDDVTAESIGVVYGKYTLAAPATSSVDAADMSVAQLKAVAAAHAKVSADSITNLSVSEKLTDTEIGNLLAKAFNASVDATDMVANQKAAVATNIDNVANITTLDLDKDDSAANIAKLLTKASGVVVDADSMDGARKAALADDIASIASITKLTLANADTIDTMSNLLTRAVDASVDAASMSAEKLAFVHGNIAKVKADGISNLSLSKEQSDTVITDLLGKAGAATNIVLTDLAEAQVTAVVGGVAKVDTVSGETTAAVLKQLDAAYAPTLNGDGAVKITKVTGSAAELKEVAIDAQAAGVNSIKLPANVALVVNNAAGTSLTAAQLSALNAAAGTVTVANAVKITGVRADVSTALVGGGAVVAATASVSITDAAGVALLASDLSAIGDKTTGAVTVENAVKISGTQAEITAAVVTPGTKVVAATADLTVDTVEAGTGTTVIDGADEFERISAIAETTTGTTTLVGTANGDTFNFTGYTGGNLILQGGNGTDTFTITQGAHTLTGGAGLDTFNISGGTQTITDLGVGNTADVVKLTGGTVTATVTGNWTAGAATVNQAASNASFVINVADAHTVNVSAASAGANDKGFTVKSTGTGAITGSGKADILENTSGNATFTGGTGNDTFIAKANTMTIATGDLTTGDIVKAEGTASVGADGITAFVATSDTLNTSSGTVTLTAATGGRTIDLALVTGGTKGFTINGNTGADTLKASAKGDILDGGDGIDEITGGAGNDVLNGGAGDDVDTLIGGGGNDTYLIADTTGADIYVEAAGGGTDTILFLDTESLVGDKFGTTLGGATANAALSQIEQIVVDTDTTATFSSAQLSGQTIGINALAAGTATIDIDATNAAAANTIDLSNLTVTAFTYVGADGAAATGVAFDANDKAVIDGGSDVDTITAMGTVINIITGAGGNDIITLGSGADTVVVAAQTAAGIDTISGFVVAADTIKHGLTEVNAAFTDVTADTVGATAGDTIQDAAGDAVGEAITDAATNWDSVGDVVYFAWEGSNYLAINAGADANYTTADILIEIGTVTGTLDINDFIT